MPVLLFVVLLAAPAFCRGVRLEFDPRNAATGPFPTDFLTVPDETQRTRLRVNLPLPDCSRRPTDCRELGIINELDGFNIQARLAVKFSGPVMPETLRAGIFYVTLEPVSSAAWLLAPAGRIVPINEVVYDPAANTAYAKPDAFLDQARQYAIVVTDAVLDAAGDPVETADGFAACLERRIGGAYCDQLSDAIGRYGSLFAPRRVVGASVFTTLSGTAFLESARSAIQNSPVSFRRTLPAPVPVEGLRAISVRAHVRTGENPFEERPFPVTPGFLAQAGIGHIAFGSFRSPRFLAERQFIPQTPTAAPVALPEVSEEIFFHLFLPAASPPPGGYPVLLAGHGLGDSRFGMPTSLAVGLGRTGYAILAMNGAGHGEGPRSEMVLISETGSTAVPAPGRGLDFDGDGRIEPSEGCVVFLPGAPYFTRDCLRQTALDYMQLVRAIKAGIDLEGDGSPDLSRDNIAFLGQSLGALYGTLLNAVEPDIPAAVLNVGGASAIQTARIAPSFSPLLAAFMAFRLPSLMSRPGPVDGEWPLRYEPVRILSRPDSAAIQEVYERAEWIESQGAPSTYATHLKSATLPGVPIKQVLFQFAWGDQTVPNPSNTALVRAANMRESTVIYRHDYAREAAPALPVNPHPYLALLGVSPSALAITLTTQQQAAGFLLSGGRIIPNIFLFPPFTSEVFETPAFLPETLNFAPPR